nr:uncharacterized protein LOC111419352 [Onthophagus taurus]
MDHQQDVNAQVPHINRVAVKIPPFWDADPQLWFINVETQFALGQITADDTKYNYVVSSLDPKYWAEVRDILSNPPPTGKYEKLKSELIRRLSATQDQKTRRLLEHEEIGDRKPSQFLRHLRALAGTVIPDDVLRPLWCDRLPTFTQAILASQKQKILDELADLADAVADANPRGRVEETATGVLPLQAMLQQMASRWQSGPSRRNRSKSRTRYDQNDNNGLCWYHARFGDSATKCKPPCSRNSGNGTGRH